MYGLAYVLIPTRFASLQEVLDRSLAPFRRGGTDDFPKATLDFDDVTEALREVHAEKLTLELSDGGLTIGGCDPTSIYDLETEPLRALLRDCGLCRWEGRPSDFEPDFEAFARRFIRWPKDPEAGGYGRWLNPLGRWDWWDLGGRFDGVITGARRRGAGDASTISSGESTGRVVLSNVKRAFGADPADAATEIEANVKLVATLLAAARAGEDQPSCRRAAHGAAWGVCDDEDAG